VVIILLCGVSFATAASPTVDIPDDANCLLQKPAATAVNQRGSTKQAATPLADTTDQDAAAVSGESGAALIRIIPLQKQYVPVSNKDGKVVAYTTAYFGEIKAGMPHQTFTVVFDTGSGHVILPRTSCRSETCAKHRRYERELSSTAQDIEHNGTPLKADAKERDQVVVSFGTGKVTGEFVQDAVCMGVSSPTCADVRLVLATEMTPDPFGHFAFDGVMGLGLDPLRLHKEFSFVGEMLSQHPGMLPLFSVFMSRHEDGQSTITFGGHDKRRAATEVAWTPVAMAELGYWQVKIKQIRIGDTVLDYCADGDCRAIVDTGTSLLGVPRASSRDMHRLLARPVPSGSNPSETDCRQVPGHSIDFDMGDHVVSLPVEDYSRPAPINMTAADNSTSLICRSLLLPVDMPAPVGPKIFIWGEPVLRRYLTVFDLEQKKIGFALASQPPPPEVMLASAATIGAPAEGSLLAGAPLRGAVSAAPPPKAESTAEAATVTV